MLLLLAILRRWRSDSLTVIKTPEGIDSNKIVKHAYSRYNLSIGIGLSQVRTHSCCSCVGERALRWWPCASRHTISPDAQLDLHLRGLVDSACRSCALRLHI